MRVLIPVLIPVLILGGTTEASALAQALAVDPRYAPVLSLAGRTRNPRLPPVPVRIGGFGGVDGLARAMREMGAAALVDATHPFAARISANAVLAAAEASVPLLAIRRPEWVPGEADQWTMLSDLTAAASALGGTPRRVLLTIGKQEIAPFRTEAQHHYVIRSVEPPDPALLPLGCVVIAARGPFAEADERRLLVEHGIEVIVTKNSGGTATRAKLDAARALGLPVLMIRRPPPSPAESVETVEGALRWLERLTAGRKRPARSSLLF